MREAKPNCWILEESKRNNARALLVHEGEVLLVQNIDWDHWSLSGGGINRREDPEICALREVWEELKIKISRADYKLGEYDDEGSIVHVFVVTVPSRDFVRAWELDDVAWFPPTNLPANTKPPTARRIQEWQEGKRDLHGMW